MLHTYNDGLTKFLIFFDKCTDQDENALQKDLNKKWNDQVVQWMSFALEVMSSSPNGTLFGREGQANWTKVLLTKVFIKVANDDIKWGKQFVSFMNLK